MAKKLGLIPKMRFKHAAHGRGLNDDEISALLLIAEKYQLPLPERLLNDLDFLMTYAERLHVGRRKRETPSSSDEMLLHNVYEALRKLQIERDRQEQGYDSTKDFGTGMNVKIKTDSNSVYQSVITANTQSAFGIKTPRDNQGNQVRVRKGSKIYVQAIGDEGRLYQFASTNVGYNTVRGISTMFLSHSANLRVISKRKAPRRLYEKPVYYYPIVIETVPGKKEVKKRARVLQERRYMGKIEDISAGGCCIRCRSPLEKGSLLKAEFDTPAGDHIELYGKVVGVNPSRMGSRMHLQFTRLSRHHLNTIDAFVLGFGEYRIGR
ncbi:flagellar brake protein [Spirochaeta dissipatitropha]